MNSRVVALADYRGTPRLRLAIEAFFSDKQLSANTRRAYRQALSAVVEDLGLDLLINQLDSRDVLEVFQQRWGSAQPATWNTRITALQSFVSYCQSNKWIDHDPMSLVVRRREPRDQTKAIPYQDLEKLWSRRDINLREKTLWRMLYETAARAGEILALDIEDMDLPRRRAVIIGKGGHKEYVFWASGTARLLSRHLAGRRRGPVFLTHPDPTSSPHGETNAHTPAGEDCPTNAPPPYSNKPPAGGHSTNSATHHSPTSARKEHPPPSSKPKADTKTHAHSPSTPNQETKQSPNSPPHSTNNDHFDEPFSHVTPWPYQTALLVLGCNSGLLATTSDLALSGGFRKHTTIGTRRTPHLARPLRDQDWAFSVIANSLRMDAVIAAAFLSTFRLHSTIGTPGRTWLGRLHPETRAEPVGSRGGHALPTQLGIVRQVTSRPYFLNTPVGHRTGSLPQSNHSIR